MRNKPCARAECRKPVLPLKCGTPRKYCSPLCYHLASKASQKRQYDAETRFTPARKRRGAA